MLTFAVFCLAAILVFLASHLAKPVASSTSQPLRAGTVFVGVVLVAAALGLAGRDMTAATATHLPHALAKGAPLLLVVAALYLLCALSHAANLPVWLSDVLVLGAAGALLFILREPAINLVRLPFTNDYVHLGLWAMPLTMGWIWAIARMTATLNRTPQVTGGYLGLVALTLLLSWHSNLAGTHAASFFPAAASAALAGAGLVSVPLALRQRDFDLGWPATFAMGFLLAQIAVVGLFKEMAFAILALMLLAFGLPLLNVSFFVLRATRRGEKVSWSQSRLHLHEALLRHGLSSAKISLLYLAVAAYFCAAGVLLVTMRSWNFFLRAAFIGVWLSIGFIVFFSLTRILMRRAEDEQVPESVDAFGVRISAVTMDEALCKIESFIASKQPHHVVTSDANAILRAQEDSEYAGILQRAALITPDGYGVIWGARLLNLPLYERVTGVDMVTGICERAVKKGYSIYILGSLPGVAATAAQKLAERYPGLRVVGTQHGYFKDEGISEAEVVERIRAARPDVLFVAFGIPSQEKFIARNLQDMHVPVSLGVGGSFDVYSEKLKRAPDYVQRIGMEWLYRVWQEPWRWKRMTYVPRFMALALRVWLSSPFRRRPAKPTP